MVEHLPIHVYKRTIKYIANISKNLYMKEPGEQKTLFPFLRLGLRLKQTGKCTIFDNEKECKRLINQLILLDDGLNQIRLPY